MNFSGKVQVPASPSTNTVINGRSLNGRHRMMQSERISIHINKVAPGRLVQCSRGEDSPNLWNSPVCGGGRGGR